MRTQATEIQDWDVEADKEHIRAGSIELQNMVHRKWHSLLVANGPDWWAKAPKPAWRVRTLEKLELFMGCELHGRVLEIGAGTALCSAMASRRTAVVEVYALDYDKFCVDEFMSDIFHMFEADTVKITRIYGSYNHIRLSEHFDFIIGVGALHHSEDLRLSFKSCFDALKPGGVMLVSDVCEPDFVSQKELADRYDTIDPDAQERFGRQVKLKDNGDHWYRLSEWIASAYAAGFDVAPYVFDSKQGRPADDEIFKQRRCYEGWQIIPYQPYFAVKNRFDPLLLVLQKPAADRRSPLIPRPSIEAGIGRLPEVPATSAGARLEKRLEQLECRLRKLDRRLDRREAIDARVQKRLGKLGADVKRARQRRSKPKSLASRIRDLLRAGRVNG